MNDIQDETKREKRSNTRKIPKTMTRKELSIAVAKRLGKTPDKVSEFVDATIESLAGLIKTADPELRIELRGLGVFEVKFMKERATIRDPRTGENINYSGRRRKMHFRPSKIIKRILQDEESSQPSKVQ